MTHADPHVLEAQRLPELLRAVCAYAGLAPPPASPEERFVVRCGSDPPGLLSALLEEAFLEDEAEAPVLPAGDLPAGHLAVQPGFDAPCPMADEMRRAVRPGGGRVVLFAIERRGDQGELLGVTWAAVPEEEPGPQAEFKAAVLRLDGVGPVAVSAT